MRRYGRISPGVQPDRRCSRTTRHAWHTKKKAPPKWGFQPRCPLSCELGLLHPQEQTFLMVSPMVRL